MFIYQQHFQKESHKYHNYHKIKSLLKYGYNEEARRISELTVQAVYKEFIRTGYLWECYHPLGGNVEELSAKGRGARTICRHFCGWTGLVLNLMLEEKGVSKGEDLL